MSLVVPCLSLTCFLGSHCDVLGFIFLNITSILLKDILKVDKLFSALDYIGYPLTDEQYNDVNLELVPDENNAVQYAGMISSRSSNV